MADVPKSPGRPLEPDVRRFFEARMGYDFSSVRVHADAGSAKSAASIGANAYTFGTRISFAANRYDPRTHAGRLLIAHELAHVVQQRTSGQDAGLMAGPGIGRVQRQPAPNPPSDPLSAPLSRAEWQSVHGWLQAGKVGGAALGGDADKNAEAVAAAIFCGRLSQVDPSRHQHDPLLCSKPDEIPRENATFRLLKDNITQGELILPVAPATMAIDSKGSDKTFDSLAKGPVPVKSLPQELTLPAALVRELGNVEAQTKKSKAEEGFRLLRGDTSKGAAYREVRAPTGTSRSGGSPASLRQVSVEPVSAVTGETLAVEAHTHPPMDEQGTSFEYPSFNMQVGGGSVGDFESFVRRPVNVFLVRSTTKTFAFVRTAEFAAWVAKVGTEAAVKELEDEESKVQAGMRDRLRAVATNPQHPLGVYFGDSDKPLRRQ